MFLVKYNFKDETILLNILMLFERFYFIFNICFKYFIFFKENSL